MGRRCSPPGRPWQCTWHASMASRLTFGSGCAIQFNTLFALDELPDDDVQELDECNAAEARALRSSGRRPTYVVGACCRGPGPLPAVMPLPEKRCLVRVVLVIHMGMAATGTLF
eukprot:7514943-Karenia_brevis.AAC.1